MRLLFTLLSVVAIQQIIVAADGSELLASQIVTMIALQQTNVAADGSKLSLSQILLSQIVAMMLNNAYSAELVNVVRSYIEDGADVNTANIFGNTLLHLASGYGDLELVRLLMENNADVKAQNEDGNTPLHTVVRNGNGLVVKLLLAHGADVNAQNKKGKTLLHYAVHDGNWSVVQVLLAHGADVNAQNKYGYTPLHYVARNENGSVVKLLLVHSADVNAQNNIGYTPLHTAVCNENGIVVQLLLEKGAEVHAQDEEGYTPLHLAVRRKWFDGVRLLIEKGVDVNVKNERGDTPLHYAIDHKNKDVIELLLQAKTLQLNVHDKKIKELLFHAAEKGLITIVRLLVEKGVDVNIRNEYRQTPLHLAVQHEKDEIVNAVVVELLKAQDIDINAEDMFFKTPLDLAADKDNIKIVMWMLEVLPLKQQKRKAELLFRRKQWSELVEFLVEREVDRSWLNAVLNGAICWKFVQPRRIVRAILKANNLHATICLEKNITVQNVLILDCAELISYLMINTTFFDDALESGATSEEDIMCSVRSPEVLQLFVQSAEFKKYAHFPLIHATMQDDNSTDLIKTYIQWYKDNNIKMPLYDHKGRVVLMGAVHNIIVTSGSPNIGLDKVKVLLANVSPAIAFAIINQKRDKKDIFYYIQSEEQKFHKIMNEQNSDSVDELIDLFYMYAKPFKKPTKDAIKKCLICKDKRFNSCNEPWYLYCCEKGRYVIHDTCRKKWETVSANCVYCSKTAEYKKEPLPGLMWNKYYVLNQLKMNK